MMLSLKLVVLVCIASSVTSLRLGTVHGPFTDGVAHQANKVKEDNVVGDFPYDEGLELDYFSDDYFDMHRMETEGTYTTDIKERIRLRCPFYDKGERFSCDLNMNLDDPEMKASSDDRTSKLRQHLAKSKSTLYFVGDSISGQYYDLFSCAMFYVGANATKVEAPIKSYASTCREFDGQFKMCSISAGTSYQQDGSVMSTINKLDEERALSSGSIIIANEGIWWRGTTRGVNEKERVESLDVSHIETDRGIKVFWRETLAQHFPSADGSFHSSEWYSTGGRCAPIQDSNQLVKLNQEVNQILQKKNIPIIPGFELSAHASSAHDHLERKTPHCKARGTDCTHWCTPSNTLHQLRDAAFKSLYDWIEGRN